jgi:hypothetical protein
MSHLSDLKPIWYQTIWYQTIWYRTHLTYQIPNLSDNEPIVCWAHQIPLSDTEPIGYQTYQIMNLSYAETYQIMNLSDTKPVRYRTSQIPNLGRKWYQSIGLPVTLNGYFFFKFTVQGTGSCNCKNPVSASKDKSMAFNIHGVTPSISW